MTVPPADHPRRRDTDPASLSYWERTLTKTQKITVAVSTIIASLSVGAGAAYHVDGRYVHSDAYAGDVNTFNSRMDYAEVRSIEGQLRNINGQILDLERQKLLTPGELAFYKQLRADKDRLEADVRELRAQIQERQRRAEMGRSR